MGQRIAGVVAPSSPLLDGQSPGRVPIHPLRYRNVSLWREANTRTTHPYSPRLFRTTSSCIFQLRIHQPKSIGWNVFQTRIGWTASSRSSAMVPGFRKARTSYRLGYGCAACGVRPALISMPNVTGFVWRSAFFCLSPESVVVGIALWH